MTFNIDHILINIIKIGNGLRLTTANENTLLKILTLEEAKEAVEINYKIVKDHYQDNVGSMITEDDLEEVSLKIALYFICIYSRWRIGNKTEKNGDLTFSQNDFANPYTSYIIIGYFKIKYPNNFREKCKMMLNMTEYEFNEFIIRKEQLEKR